MNELLRTTQRWARRWGQQCGSLLLDTLLPAECLGCDAPAAGTGQFCADCFNRMQFISEPCCDRCGLPFEHSGAMGPARLCPACLAAPPPWHRARAAMLYDERSRGIILPLKHADRPELATALGLMMTRAGARLLDEADLLVPVPLHPSRLRARRYNQAALLARAIGRRRGVALAVDALVRVRATPPLGELSALRRAEVTASAFAVRRGRAHLIAGRRVLLIDDVLTSGATCGACTHALAAAGAAQIDVLVAARVPDPRGGDG